MKKAYLEERNGIFELLYVHIKDLFLYCKFALKVQVTFKRARETPDDAMCQI